jgi:hypothetical protein
VSSRKAISGRIPAVHFSFLLGLCIFCSSIASEEASIVKMRLSTILSVLAFTAGIVEAGRSLQHVGKKDKPKNLHKRASVPDKSKRAESSLKPRYLSSATESKSIETPKSWWKLTKIQNLLSMALPFQM